MKEKRLWIHIFLLLFLYLFSSTTIISTPVIAATNSSAITALPRLQVKGTSLVNSQRKTVQLHGISTHGLSWYPEYVNQDAFSFMKKNWNVNVIRLAMYTAEYNGYCTGDDANRQKLEKCIDDGVRYATNAGMYVIIDWHILSDGNPKQNQKMALRFFKKMAKRYKNNTNVIYEICNEPNGGTSWNTIKKYAQKIIKGIRTYDKKALILVGTPNWSQDVDQVSISPLSKKYRKNVMYTLHFYAATHKQWLRDKAQTAIDNGLPLFVSEFSICDASGNGNLDKAEAKKWLRFLNQNKISYVAWSLSNKPESASFIKPNCNKIQKWSSKDLTAAGKWIRDQYKRLG